LNPLQADADSAIRRRQFVLDSGLCVAKRPPRWHASPACASTARPMNLARIDVETKLGTLEVWEIVSLGMAHPFHVHGASFRILSLAGTPPACSPGGLEGRGSRRG